jgi:hypothetical protein
MYNRSIQDPNGFWSDMAKEFHWDKQVGCWATDLGMCGRVLGICSCWSMRLERTPNHGSARVFLAACVGLVAVPLVAPGATCPSKPQGVVSGGTHLLVCLMLIPYIAKECR